MYSTFDTTDIRTAHCETLITELSERFDKLVSETALSTVPFSPWDIEHQTTLGYKPEEELTCFLFPMSEAVTAQEMIGNVDSLAEANCNAYYPSSDDHPYILHDHPEESPREALLAFMASVLPSDLAVTIFDDPTPYLDDMVISSDGFNLYIDEISDDLPTMHISNVVGTIGDVKVGLAFMQVPTQEDPGVMGLEMVWKVSDQQHLCSDTNRSSLSSV